MRSGLFNHLAVFICSILLLTNCETNEPYVEPELNLIINGDWTGYLILDEYDNEKTASESFTLKILQDGNSLTASMTIPPEYNITSPVSLRGKLNTDSTFTLDSFGEGNKIHVSGIIESGQKLQLGVSGIETEVQLISMSKKNNTPIVMGEFDNDYKLVLKHGIKGIGRSTILVHGMSDNAETWNDMLDYMKDHGLNINNKASGILKLPDKTTSGITFKVKTTGSNPQEGTAVADVYIGEILNKKLIGINIKSTTIPGVNMFKESITGQMAELGKTVSITRLQVPKEVTITLIYGENDVGNVWVFEYKWWLHIIDNSLKMKEMVKSLQAKGDISDEPLIVGHSMGGLVSRGYIASYGDFYKLVTLGTPHLGSDLSNIVPFGTTTGVGDLRPDSDFLADLNDDAHEKTQRSKYWLLNGRAGTHYVCKAYAGDVCVTPGYEWYSPEPSNDYKAYHAALEKPNDCMVPQSSARFEGDENVRRINTFEWLHHKVLNTDSRICEWVCNFLRQNQ
jgi:triacylglycerol esterase/lipase EstA (alpha/beta hydrolase family)